MSVALVTGGGGAIGRAIALRLAHDGFDVAAVDIAVTDSDGAITGVLRTWLAHDGAGKAPVTTPRRALERLTR